MEIDKIIHEPARLRIIMILHGVQQADFNFLLGALGLTRGNLSRHVEKLQLADYIKVKKSFNGKIPHTAYQITAQGRHALAQYWKTMDSLRQQDSS